MRSDGSWFGILVCMERMTQMSSIISPTFGNNSLTSIPASPYLLNLNGDLSNPPVLRSVDKSAASGRWPLYLSNAGLGSKVSTCEGPPFINKWMMCLARGAKCGAFGAKGLSLMPAGASAASVPSPAIMPAMPSMPRPVPIFWIYSRRVSP